MGKPNLLFAIDISGIPPKNTCVGCVSINLRILNKFQSEFEKRFSKLKHKKGKQLKHYQLQRIMSFLDEFQIRSCSSIYNTTTWENALNLIPRNKAYKIEKILGMIYFILLNKYSQKNSTYLVHICEESQFKINVIRSTCREIGKANGITYNITLGTDKTDFAIKMADYIASATRKIKFEKIQDYQYFNYSKSLLKKDYINKAFDLI